MAFIEKERRKPPPQPPPRSKSTPTLQERARPTSWSSWPAPVRLVVSVLIVWHLSAVFLAPFSIPPSSMLARDIAQRPPMQWYLDALYLNHGYHFFAPDPGPGHLIRFEILDDRGQRIAEGEFPNLKDEWPRLRYHRYFMLTDQLIMPMRSERETREFAIHKLNRYAHQLLREYGGYEARLVYVRHDILSPDEKLDGQTLDAPHKYVTVQLDGRPLQTVQTIRDAERAEQARHDEPDPRNAFREDPYRFGRVR